MHPDDTHTYRILLGTERVRAARHRGHLHSHTGTIAPNAPTTRCVRINHGNGKLPHMRDPQQRNRDLLGKEHLRPTGHGQHGQQRKHRERDGGRHDTRETTHWTHCKCDRSRPRVHMCSTVRPHDRLLGKADIRAAGNWHHRQRRGRGDCRKNG